MTRTARRGVRVGVRTDTWAGHTARLYAGDWARFLAFCAAAGGSALPATPAVVAAFLGSPGLGRAVRRRALAAIDVRHRQLGLPPPGDDPSARAALKAARRAQPRRSRPAPPSPTALRAAALRCPRDLAGLRDRAALLLLAHGVRRGALVALQAERLRWRDDRVELGDGLALQRAVRHELCPARALDDWLRASATRYGPVFRKVTRWGTVEPHALGADAVRRILLARLP